MKRKVLFVTLNDYVIYQPTILNLYDLMVEHMDVKIISFSPSYVTKTKDETRNIVYLSPPRLPAYLISKMDFAFSKVVQVARIFKKDVTYQYKYYNTFLPSIVKKWLRLNEKQADIVIAVDLPALKIAQEVYGQVHFLSLEVENRESKNYFDIDPSRILSVLIQSKERLDYIFPDFKPPVFIVQNSPKFDARLVTAAERVDFVFAGTARRVFGIFECIEFIKRNPPFRMIQKGGGEQKVITRIRKDYGELIESGRLRLDNSYLSSEEFISFLSGFRIGFCFYSWDLIHSYFNYRTAPSGKLFMYMAAGVPVIASNIEGFRMVTRYKAGVLINDYQPKTILEAVKQIEADYETYSENCLKMAKDLSFEKMASPYISFLQNS
jgi:glycosyltransferase involved in cell wall biosynthesis